MTRTGLCDLWWNLSRSGNSRKFVSAKGSRTCRELAAVSAQVPASSRVPAARPWGPRVCEPTNLRRPRRKFPRLVTPATQRTCGGIPPPIRGGFRAASSGRGDRP